MSSIRHRFTATLLFVCAAATLAHADLTPIRLDGYFDDWVAVAPQYIDPAGDGGSGANGVDFRAVAVANDQDYLYLRFEVTGNVQPDEQQAMELYLDTDMNAATGTAFGGIGAELVWKFGTRTGTFRPASTNYTINHNAIGLMMGPTVSNNQFEVALLRNAVPGGGATLMPGASVRFILRDATSGDLAPNSGSISYTFAPGSDIAPTIPLARDAASNIRVMSWNILSDGIFDAAKQPAQNRILDAIDPDILVFCEVFNHTAAQTQTQLESFLPSAPGEQWYTAKIDGGNVIASRFPILQTWLVLPGTTMRETAALLDLGPAYPTDLLFIGCHLRAGTADANRQMEADGIISFLRDARTAGGLITLPANTPFIIGGDMNLVGWRQQLDTILTGDIIDNATYGADSPPDWDGTALAAVPFRQVDGRAGYTWRNDTGSFYPGMLDWIFYTDSALTLHNHFILETRTMMPATLAAGGVQAADSPTASDHDPRVADFTIGTYVSAVPGADAAVGPARLLANAPNPFNPSTQLRFVMDRAGDAALGVYDARGALVRAFPAAPYEAGLHAVTWDGRDATGRPAASGVYQVRMSARVDGRMVRQVRSIVLAK